MADEFNECLRIAVCQNTEHVQFLDFSSAVFVSKSWLQFTFSVPTRRVLDSSRWSKMDVYRRSRAQEPQEHAYEKYGALIDTFLHWRVISKVCQNSKLRLWNMKKTFSTFPTPKHLIVTWPTARIDRVSRRQTHETGAPSNNIEIGLFEVAGDDSCACDIWLFQLLKLLIKLGEIKLLQMLYLTLLVEKT